MNGERIADAGIEAGLALLVDKGLAEELTDGPGTDPRYRLTDRGRALSTEEIDKIIDQAPDLELAAREDICRYLRWGHREIGPRSEAEIVAALQAAPGRNHRPGIVRAAIEDLAEARIIRRSAGHDTWTLDPRYVGP